MEAGPGDRFSECHSYIGVSVLHRFINKEKHFEVPFYFQEFADIGKVIKEVTISSTEMNRDNISMILNSF